MPANPLARKYLKLLGAKERDIDETYDFLLNNQDQATLKALYEGAIQLLGDYCKWQHHVRGLEPVVRFFTGNWDHTHTDPVEKVLNKHDRVGCITHGDCGIFGQTQPNLSLQILLEDLKTELLRAGKPLKQDGELAKRIRFIQELAKLNTIDLTQFCDEAAFKKLEEEQKKADFLAEIDAINPKIKTHATISLPFGKALFISGKHKNLGQWKSALRMDCQDPGNAWAIELSRLTANSDFKFLIGDYNLGEKVKTSELTWEEGDNRKLVMQGNTLFVEVSNDVFNLRRYREFR